MNRQVIAFAFPAIPIMALLAACGGETPQGSTATPTPSPTSAAITDPAPPAFASWRWCHSTQPGINGIGPTLHGIVGSSAGEVQGYAFSPALKGSGITWDRKNLDTWLQGPMKMVPGTKMVLPVPDPKKRQDIIDYLETLK